MPPKPETLLALSHSEESGESLGVQGGTELLERSRQNLPPEMQGAANATALAHRTCVIAHAAEPLRYLLGGLNDFLPIEPTECRAQSDYLCSHAGLPCPQQDGLVAFERISPTGAGRYKDHCTCYAAIDFFCLRVCSRFRGSCSGPALLPCSRRVTTRLPSTPASCCRRQRLQASAARLRLSAPVWASWHLPSGYGGSPVAGLQ